ncbi:MAG: gamma-glutamylcyclotransferase [Thermodesulfatator sp.]|nr:MAG: gamma-glutamylcyclotransferase [Thermodesulfatator sp.]
MRGVKSPTKKGLSQRVLFVYGTLRQGQPLHKLLQGANFLGEGRVQGFALYDLGDYPAACPQEGGLVWGELYEVPEDIISLLDEVEDEYCRETVQVELLDGGRLQAQMYVFRRSLPESLRIFSGKWEKSFSS